MTGGVLDALAGGLVVSCQAYPGEPMRSPEMMAAVAQTVVLGGACGVRVQGIADIAAVRALLDVPVVGLVKAGDADVFITPTREDVRQVCAAGADVVAVDGTRRDRPDGGTLRDSVELAHSMGRLVMADCGSVTDAEHAVASGADVVASTLAGYTGERSRTEGPDVDLVRAMAGATDLPVVAEGRVDTPAEALACLDAGAFAVVVGSAITHPGRITQRFVRSIRSRTVA